jgi:hypothetical protein
VISGQSMTPKRDALSVSERALATMMMHRTLSRRISFRAAHHDRFQNRKAKVLLFNWSASAPCAGFSDAGMTCLSHALMRPASEKRQGTKSREVRQR